MSERPGEAEAVEAATLAVWRSAGAGITVPNDYRKDAVAAVAAAYPIIAAAARADEQAVREDELNTVAAHLRTQAGRYAKRASRTPHGNALAAIADAFNDEAEALARLARDAGSATP